MHLRFLAATGQDDPETPYKNIVAVGPHAATLHHITYDKRASSASPETLLVDAGSTYQGYCSDITRTWSRGEGAIASAFAHLVDAVDKMQRDLCVRVKLGLPYEELHEESHRQASAILCDLGVVKGSVDEAVQAGISRSFYPHGLGHSLGLQCHDVGCALVKPKENNPYLRNTSIITLEGQSFTDRAGHLLHRRPARGDSRPSEHGGMVDWALVGELSVMGGVTHRRRDVVVTRGERGHPEPDARGASDRGRRGVNRRIDGARQLATTRIHVLSIVVALLELGFASSVLAQRGGPRGARPRGSSSSCSCPTWASRFHLVFGGRKVRAPCAIPSPRWRWRTRRPRGAAAGHALFARDPSSADRLEWLDDGAARVPGVPAPRSSRPRRASAS